MQIDVRKIEFNKEGYNNMLTLRNKMLREPDGRELSQLDKINDDINFLIGAFANGRLVGCCMLEALGDNKVIKLAQMAVDGDFHHKGIGRKVLAFASKQAKNLGASEIYLDARMTAKKFYLNCGYEAIGEEFIKSDLPHIGMILKL